MTTPKTDACAKNIDQSNFVNSWKDKFEEFAWVPADFACQLERELTAATEQRDEFKTELEIANLRLKGKRHPDDNGIMADGEIDVKALTEQRDALAEALEQLMAYQPRSIVITTNKRHAWSNAKNVLQSLNQPEP